MTTSSVWNTKDHDIEMKRKNSYSLFSQQMPAARMYPSKDDDTQKYDDLFKMMESCKANDAESVKKDIVQNIEYRLACTRFSFTKADAYRAASLAVRDRLVESLNDTNAWYKKNDVKRAYYLSAEYLLGRAFQNALANLDLDEPFKDALFGLGLDLEELTGQEADPGLGNGGLGRLAACFLDSMATLSLPCMGYGIRYRYGIFQQHIINGKQVERPDHWLANPVPWEIERADIIYPVRFGGTVEEYHDSDGHWRQKWVGGEIVQAMAYDTPIPGFDTYNTNCLRLWRACPAQEFDFDAFNESDYANAIEERRRAEDISAVLYPNDDKYEGKVLRLKQQYFFVCASLQDLLREFASKPNRDWNELPEKVAVQMNDTHPTMAVLELMRILVDVQKLNWDQSWDLTRKTLNYTNHTVMPEALEKWPVEMIQEYLPRHLQICGEINHRFIQEVIRTMGDGPEVPILSLFQEEPFKGIRMGNIAVLGCNKVNGVAAIHTEIVKKETFAEMYQWFCKNGDTNKFVNMTNGVTPRRWIHVANRPLSDLYTKQLGSHKWLTDMELLKPLKKKSSDPLLQKEWMDVKRQAKLRLADFLRDHMGFEFDVDALLDCQFKRIHEYKRQFMNALYLIHRYMMIKKASPAERAKIQKRVSIFGGKAAPAYIRAKTIIKLINNIAEVVNNDPDVSPYLKVAFVPNYSVTVAQYVTPASDISEHISTAGTEASGTSNMKFVMNGGLIIGTMDGANIEIREEGGSDTMFIFGCLEDQIPDIKKNAKAGNYPIDSRMQEVFNQVKSGRFSLGDDKSHAEFCALIDTLCNITAAGTWDGDKYLLIQDFPSYIDAQNRVDATYADKQRWCKLSIEAATSMAKFSTDRTISEYAEVIWGVKESKRPMTMLPAGGAQVVAPNTKLDGKTAEAPPAVAPSTTSDAKTAGAPPAVAPSTTSDAKTAGAPPAVAPSTKLDAKTKGRSKNSKTEAVPSK